MTARRLAVGTLALALASCATAATSEPLPATGSPPPSASAGDRPTTPAGAGRETIDLGGPGTLILDTGVGIETDPADLVIEGLTTTGARRTIGRIVDYRTRLPQGWDREGGPRLLISDSGYVAMAVERLGSQLDGSDAQHATAIFDLGRPDAPPVVLDGSPETFAGDALVVLRDGGYDIHQPGQAEPVRIDMAPETDLVFSRSGAPLLAADGRSLIAAHASPDGAVDYSLITLDRQVRPLGHTLPPTRYLTGDDRPIGAAGEWVATFCSDGVADSFCGLSVGLGDGSQWSIKVDGDVNDFAWTFDGSRLVVIGTGPTLYLATREGTVKVADLGVGSNPQIVGMTSGRVIVSVETDQGTRLLAAPLDGSGITQLGGGSLIRIVDPVATG